MLLDVLDDVFLLNLPLETAEGALNRFPVLDLDFSHSTYPFLNARTSGVKPNMLGYHE